MQELLNVENEGEGCFLKVTMFESCDFCRRRAHLPFRRWVTCSLEEKKGFESLFRSEFYHWVYFVFQQQDELFVLAAEEEEFSNLESIPTFFG